MGRARLLLTKYAVGACTVLAAAVSGKALIVGVATLRGYPVGQLRISEPLLSVLVLWLGVLFVLGVGLLASVIFRSVLVALVACASTSFLVFALPSYAVDLIARLQEYPTNHPYGWAERLTLLTYWMPTYYYYGDSPDGLGGFAATNFLVCLAAALVPLLAALWLFRRREY